MFGALSPSRLTFLIRFCDTLGFSLPSEKFLIPALAAISSYISKMMHLSLKTTTGALVASLFSEFSHRFYLVHGEHHTVGLTYIQAAFSPYFISITRILFSLNVVLLYSMYITTLVFRDYLGSFTNVLRYQTCRASQQTLPRGA